MTTAVASRALVRMAGTIVVSSSPCNPRSLQELDRYGKQQPFARCCRKTRQTKLRWTTNCRLVSLMGGHPLASERRREGHKWQTRRRNFVGLSFNHFTARRDASGAQHAVRMTVAEPAQQLLF